MTTVEQDFLFETVTVDAKGAIAQRTSHKVSGLKVDLGNGIDLNLMTIPSGTMAMGAPTDEEAHQSTETPQHNVTVGSFQMGQYPITQGQWRAVVESTEPIGKPLNPIPSKFKHDFAQAGDRWTRPVERVNWYDAIEFCARLSRKTGQNYALPSEAQWEYACRGGTPTPFHFGATIMPNLANYWGKDDSVLGWRGRYAQAPQGQPLEQPTPVGYFRVANAFGLYDMHGNIAEWCADCWHSNYQGAPTDGSVWDEIHTTQFQDVNRNIGALLKSQSYRVVRGGSWYSLPGACRSAFRLRGYAMSSLDLQGFRVCSI